MPAGQRPVAASTRVIRSVAVRTRDGPERLDQAYRRLTDNIEREQPRPAPGLQPELTDVDRAPEPGR
jgi:hypothetical protein